MGRAQKSWRQQQALSWFASPCIFLRDGYPVKGSCALMPRRMFRLAAVLALNAFASLPVSSTLPPTPEKGKTREFDVAGSPPWLDTGIDVRQDDGIRVTASGNIRISQYRESGPDGIARQWLDLLRIFPLNDANAGALLGRIGDGAESRPFLLGSEHQIKAAVGGRLFLGINEPENEPAEGSFHVKVEVVQQAATAKPAPQLRLPQVTQKMLDSIPVRVADASGNPGDRVNFLIIGSEDQLKQALKDAGWVIVNRSARDAVIQGVIAVLSRQAYTQLPMSELFLFGRPQDFGYAQADPLRVVASRHHFRLWKAPFQVEGQTLWVGAGTHDIGFDRDQRTGGITHKIDPDTDQEREFIGRSLEATGLAVGTYYVTPTNPLKEAKTAHGETFNSDGRTLVIALKPEVGNDRQAFSNLFCSVLREKNPDGGEWGDCSQYLETPPTGQVELPPIPDRYRLLIVPGLLNTCIPNAPDYKEGQEYLHRQYGLAVEFLPLPNDSCEDNARRIAEFLKAKMKGDSHKFIVIGYSKGAPDLQVALAREPDAAKAVAAFISVAGAIGGSPIADLIPGVAGDWIRKYNLSSCTGDLSAGFKSLSQATRQAFLAKYPDPVVPTYSLPAISDKANTSELLVQTWQIIAAYSEKQDGQLTVDDATVPGSKRLGSALADHFAVAVPFETSNESIKAGADKNHYPRTALLEAMVRFAIGDLESQK